METQMDFSFFMGYCLFFSELNFGLLSWIEEKANIKFLMETQMGFNFFMGYFIFVNKC